MPIEVDDTRRPLIVVTFTGAPSDREFEAYFVELEAKTIARRERFVCILDATRSTLTSAAQRARQAQWLEQHDAELREHSLGNAFVIRSPVVRGVLTAILWMQPMSVPHTVVATRDEAIRWATERLARVGLAPRG